MRKLALAMMLVAAGCAPDRPAPSPPSPSLSPPAPLAREASAPAAADAATEKTTTMPGERDAAAPSASADARAPAPAPEPAPVIVAIEYVNLSVEHANLNVDARGHAAYAREQAFKEHLPVEPVREAVVGKDVLDRLVDEAKRLCKSPPRDEEGMMWTRVVVELPDARCNVRVSSSTWRKRLTAFVRAAGAVEAEVCGGPCGRPLF